MGSFIDFQGLSGHGKSPHSAGQCLVELLCAGRAFDPVAKKKAKQANATRGNAEDAWALAVQALIEDMPVASPSPIIRTSICNLWAPAVMALYQF